MRTLFFEDGFSAARLLVVLGMNRDKNATLLDFSLVALGFVLRYAQSDQGSSEASP